MNRLLSRTTGSSKLFVWASACLIMALASAQEEEMPDHDISLFELNVSQNEVSIARPQVIADRVGYDNQPRFIDNDSLYYTSMDDISADVWHWQTGANNQGVVKRITNSLESEYSPTPIPFRSGALSTILVEHDGTQRLWQVNADGSFELLFKNIKPVGYHVWQDQNIAMFVLGEPHRLEVTRLGQEETKVVDEAIGRTLLNVPGTNKISYSVEQEGRHQLKLYSFAEATSEILMLLPDTCEDYAWLGSDKLISSDGDNLLWADVINSTWQKVTLPEGLILKGLSRIAVSPDNKRIAIVHHK